MTKTIPVDRGLVFRDKPQTTRYYNGSTRVSATEWVRRTFGPLRMPRVPELGSVGATMLRFGQIARSIATGQNWYLDVVKLYHPDYEDGVNGWPPALWNEAWSRMEARYGVISWEFIAPEPTPVPDQPQPSVFSNQLLGQIQEAVETRKPSFRSDPEWQAAKQLLDRDPRERMMGESPEKALIRRQSASAAMFAVEKRYEAR